MCRGVRGRIRVSPVSVDVGGLGYPFMYDRTCNGCGCDWTLGTPNPSPKSALPSGPSRRKRDVVRRVRSFGSPCPTLEMGEGVGQKR